MRLKYIKLAGFKSFVDSTKVEFPNQLSAVVGPNGCGKSNVIDAARWVMGESSAKQLRGESLADVIFNGSAHRKPVGQATIELVFDNSLGKIGGEYAKYNEIALRRELTRDGQSSYFLNGTRCRRRDIKDIFHGTGLGPRSYAIIEQGTISRFIEARPEEIRSHIEDVAGISKYKERRRETENRIRHTRENLERLTDLRDELEKQLAHLKRQANAAERYSELKEQEHLLQARVLALRYQAYADEMQASTDAIGEQEVALEASIAELRNIDLSIEHTRDSHQEFTDRFNEVQARFYQMGGEIGRLEQSIQHSKERRQQLEDDQAQAEDAWNDITSHLEKDKTQSDTMQEQVETLQPEMEEALAQQEQSSEALHAAEESMQACQERWDAFQKESNDATNTAQVTQTRIQHLEEQLQQMSERLQGIETELTRVSDDALAMELAQIDERLQTVQEEEEQVQSQLQNVTERMKEQRHNNHQLSKSLDEARIRLQRLEGRKASLEALQQAALGQQENDVIEWVDNQSLKDNPRLAQGIKVKQGYEKAAETVLGFYLEAICVDELQAYATKLEGLDQGKLALFNTQNQHSQSQSNADSLLSKIESQWSLDSILSGIYVADNVEQALQKMDGLQSHESIITRDGVWLGSGWLRVNAGNPEKSGVLVREQELKDIETEIQREALYVEQASDDVEKGRDELAEFEQTQEQQQRTLREVSGRLSDLSAQRKVKENRIEHMRSRAGQLREEQEQLLNDQQEKDQSLTATREQWQAALSDMEQFSGQQNDIEASRENQRRILDESRVRSHTDKDRAHELQMRYETLRAQLDGLQQNIERGSQQITSLRERRESLKEALAQLTDPQDGMAAELQVLLDKRLTVEDELREAKQHLENADHQARHFEEQRVELDQRIQTQRERLEKTRLSCQEMEVRRKTIIEQLVDTEFQLEQLLQEMPEDAVLKSYEEELQHIASRIQRLGPINLAAIDEYATQSERKIYLDAQNGDLEEALQTLENAIQRIDRETRARFKETFDKVNQGIQKLFPKIFGGGRAYLELTGDDLLDTGITVMAQPPGKRNSSIHLLSGGEKALTALSLVFSLFQLNPSPFCMLDEVDAPLDDANVGRFCNLVKEMSETVQFIVISHNKVTIEMAQSLLGVTMHEPGVSRLVSVDVDEAVAMAEA